MSNTQQRSEELAVKAGMPPAGSAIQISARRVGAGIMMSVSVIPEIEEFFRQLSGETQVPAIETGRSWSTIGDAEGDNPPKVWALPRKHIINQVAIGYSLYGAGGDLGLGKKDVSNISILRLVGASQPNGVQFMLDTILSEQGIKKLAYGLYQASEQFYNDLIRSIDFSVDVPKIENFNRGQAMNFILDQEPAPVEQQRPLELHEIQRFIQDMNGDEAVPEPDAEVLDEDEDFEDDEFGEDQDD
jgi:hypothetical protein